MRKSGILLHPTSLPGDLGIGDLGKWAYRFADFLSESGQSIWQILPLGPTGFGYSPYQAYSSIAGNGLLISIRSLADRGWLAREDLQKDRPFPDSAVDFEAVLPLKKALIRKAARAFFQTKSDALLPEFRTFCADARAWLEPFARYAALKELNGDSAWTDWDPKITAGEQDILDQKFVQFEFFRQWRSLKKYCNERGIEIVGDIPIFVSHDSADVWANPELFHLDEKGMPKTVAGVPPDYFSETGQFWGNPLYRWDVMEQTGYRWWIARVRSMMDIVDRIRLDHFRGFEAFWEIPAGSKTAAGGRWVKGPGDRLFRALQDALGELPFIAEDLGFITPEVHALRDRWGFPGMRVLQFAFGDASPQNPHKPYNFIPNCVAYTGTHDNDTTAGWFSARTDPRFRAERDYALRYMGVDGTDAVWDFVRLLLSSVADTAIMPMQDVLELGSDARMNIPAVTGKNWLWRMREDQMTPELAAKLGDLSRLYGRGAL